jgi:hypothetical protein
MYPRDPCRFRIAYRIAPVCTLPSPVLGLEEAQQKATPVLRMFLYTPQHTTTEHTISNRSATGGKKQWESTNLDEKSDVIRMYGRNNY